MTLLEQNEEASKNSSRIPFPIKSKIFIYFSSSINLVIFRRERERESFSKETTKTPKK